MKLLDLVRKAKESLSSEYAERGERDAIVAAMMGDYLSLPSYSVVTEPFMDVEDSLAEAFLDCTSRLASGEPYQYVTGKASFCGRDYVVAPGVLIPRPETEYLCHLACRDIKASFGDRSLTVLDLCTGSGCIAWTLALEFPSARVFGVDISEDALRIAEGQFGGAGDSLPEDAHGAVVRRLPSRPVFVKADVLKGVPESLAGEFPGGLAQQVDVMVSNPPYVLERERALMRRNVLEHEPEIALFVPDANPLKFYKAVRDWAERLLRPGGLLFLEQNEALPDETAALFSSFSRVETVNDLNGKPRFTFCVR